jgi:outer membrane protein TolC
VVEAEVRLVWLAGMAVWACVFLRRRFPPPDHSPQLTPTFLPTVDLRRYRTPAPDLDVAQAVVDVARGEIDNARADGDLAQVDIVVPRVDVDVAREDLNVARADVYDVRDGC